MKRTLKNLKTEALEYKISIKEPCRGKVEFVKCDGSDCPVAWMYRDEEGNWTGFTRNPSATGKKRGNKVDVMNWCLDWSINGF